MTLKLWLPIIFTCQMGKHLLSCTTVSLAMLAMLKIVSNHGRNWVVYFSDLFNQVLCIKWEMMAILYEPLWVGQPLFPRLEMKYTVRIFSSWSSSWLAQIKCLCVLDACSKERDTQEERRSCQLFSISSGQNRIAIVHGSNTLNLVVIMITCTFCSKSRRVRVHATHTKTHTRTLEYFFAHFSLSIRVKFKSNWFAAVALNFPMSLLVIQMQRLISFYVIFGIT